MATDNPDISPREALLAAWIAAGWSERDFDVVLRQAAAEGSTEPEPEPEPTGPRYPDVEVELTGQDGNGFFIIGRVQRALRAAGVSKEERDAYTAEATAGNYDELVATTMRWVSVS
jgi:hypothetical protein